MSTQLNEAPAAPSQEPAAPRPAVRTLLLLLATEGLTEEWRLLSAASLILSRAIDETEVEALITAGLVTRRRTCLTLVDDQVVTTVLDAEAPSAVSRAHTAWAKVLAGDPLNRAWHESMAHLLPDRTAARRARAAAQRFQASGRHDEAVDLFDRAAWLTEDPSESAQLLTEGAACAFAAGLWRRATELLVTARRIETPDELAGVIDVLESSFLGSGDAMGTWQQQIAAAKVLRDWGQTSAAFAVMAATPTHAWGDLGTTPERSAPPTGRAGARALAGLVTLNTGSVSLSLPVLERAVQELEANGEHGAAAIALALVGETAACLGQVSTATAALLQARQLSSETVQPRWLERVALATSLLGARRGQYVPPESGILQSALLSGCPNRRDRAELIQAVELLAHDRWVDGYDILVTLVDRPRASIRVLIAWGLLSHLADAALHTDRVPRTRALISALADTEGLFENDIALAELLYATAVLSDQAHADTSYEALLSHDPGRWPWLSARSHLARGKQLRRTRRASDARRHLVTAQRMFTAMASQPWERLATHELRACGVRRTGGSIDTSPSLPPQELEIARMAARGLTNKEIGTVLALSPRTVGAHLYRIFPKLGITKRIQLASALEA
ncbi:LuxR C-terminal-related transcriptional regulator [Kribbella sp. NBC_00382]|uniref:helix-turn-helix transcriptional regulator n=1 Tax=Kribbella sp. NBC_00382 TaxID=2975967 RepID=UPI002E1B2895